MLIRDDNVLVTYKGDKLNIDSVDVVTIQILLEVQTKESETETETA